jgi:hypothetical protein
MEMEAENRITIFHEQRRAGSSTNAIVGMLIGFLIMENLVHLGFTVRMQSIIFIHFTDRKQASQTSSIK